MCEELLGKIVELDRRFARGPQFVKCSKDYVEFDNKSRIKIATSITHLRGVSCDLLIFDDAASIQKPHEVLACAMPVYLSSGNSQILFLSAPAGLDNYFYDLYRKAHNFESSSFIATRMHTSDILGRVIDDPRACLAGIRYRRDVLGEFCGFDK